MKNLTKLFGITALVAVVIFSMTACDTGGGSKVSVNIRSSNNNGTKPSGARSVVSRAVEITPFATNIFDSFYTGLGSQVGSNITPTKFNVYATINVVVNDLIYTLDEGFLDFVQGFTVNVGEVPEDVTVQIVALDLIYTGVVPASGNGGWCTVEFPVTAAYASAFSSSQYAFTYPAFSGLSAYTTSVAGTTAKFLFNDLLPERRGGTERSIRTIVYHDTATRDIVDSYLTLGNFDFGSVTMSGGQIEFRDRVLAVPFNPIHIPGGTSSVTFGISLNINGIIQQYAGTDNTANTADDYFVLKNGWWNDVYITANVE